MNKGKAILVTMLVSAMLGVILAGLYKLGLLRPFTALAGCLALYGFACAAVHFCRWLLVGHQMPLLPARTELWQPDEAWGADYMTIKDEEGCEEERA